MNHTEIDQTFVRKLFRRLCKQNPHQKREAARGPGESGPMDSVQILWSKAAYEKQNTLKTTKHKKNHVEKYKNHTKIM